MHRILMFLLVSVAAIGCEKASVPFSPFTTAGMLAASNWQLRKVEVAKPPGGIPGDVTLTHYKICELDDIIEFSVGGAYNCSENTQVCFPGNNSPFFKVAGGTWLLSNNDSILTISRGTEVVSMRIHRASRDSLDLRQRHFNLQGQEMEYIFTLAAL